MQNGINLENWITQFKRDEKDTKLHKRIQTGIKRYKMLKGFLRKLYNQIIIKDLENWITELWKRQMGYKTAQKNS